MENEAQLRAALAKYGGSELGYYAIILFALIDGIFGVSNYFWAYDDPK